MSDQELKDQIADAATRMFAENGTEFTMQDIAEYMQISKKTIYRAFSSKEELLICMLDLGFVRIKACKAEVLASDLPYAEKLGKALVALPEDYLKLDFRRLAVIGDKYPKVRRRLMEQLSINWEPVEAFIREGQRNGQLSDFSLPILKATFAATLTSFLLGGCLEEEGIGYQEALSQLEELLLKGMEARPPKQEKD